ncbi:hypothetical protein [Aquimarina sp. 2201CG5-10]|uniref:hypothetical protein n=1 Tax=Aquimarina callyspongiae TaxID=3098150 RepID=UPI002AB32CF2|nr:hypothetical protein [Aquimarina sp. 2201CG5-10]MDY8136368.1 hypothetical protein [Aquimarina sp. 2201CG5-10]
MKKSILTTFLCFTLLSMISCKKDAKVEQPEVEEVVEDVPKITETTEEEPVKKVKKTPKKKPKKKESDLPPGTPTFSDAAAKKYVRDYEAYITKYKKAIKDDDMDALLELGKASSSLNQQYNSLISKLSGEEIEKLSKYVQTKSKQIGELTKDM